MIGNTSLLFRVDPDTEEEHLAAKAVWGDALTRNRSDLPEDSLVIGRYSCLPFYADLERELRESKNSRLANTHEQHRYIADMQWADRLSGMTPQTWFNVGWANAPRTEHGWVVKGRTNSRKFKWATHMYAPDRDRLKDVMSRLYDDPLIADQGLAVREYLPLKKLGEGINGLPLTNEWRCFFWGDQLVSCGFYWSILDESDVPHFSMGGRNLAGLAAKVLSKDLQFFVVDVAELDSGGWTVIEINDGQMSGLSDTDPSDFYAALSDRVAGNPGPPPERWTWKGSKPNRP